MRKKCKKCKVLIDGEFRDKRSKIKRMICNSCDGSKSEEIEYSMTPSGIVNGS